VRFRPGWHLVSCQQVAPLRSFVENVSAQPLVSVCIPCYNGERFIGKTLEGVLTQDLTNLEVILTDDDSSDSTVLVIRRFGDPRIKLIQNERNLGLGLNWNKALSCTRGKYVKLLGQDDLLSRDCLSRQVSILEDPANAGVVLAVCNRTIIDSEGKVVFRRKFPFGSGRINGVKLIQISVRRGGNLIGEPVVGLFRRECLAKTKMCDPTNPYYIDLALWAALLKQGDAFVDRDCLASFRISRDSATSRIGLRQAAYFRALVRSLRRDPFYRITSCEAMIGCALSLQWCLLRNLFIKLHTTGRRIPALPAQADDGLLPCADRRIGGPSQGGRSSLVEDPDQAVKSCSTCSSLS